MAEENALQKVKSALQELLTLLDKDIVKKAIEAIPDSIMNPVIEGLKEVLKVIKDGLEELKKNLGDALKISEIVGPVNSLLDAAGSLASSQSGTIDKVKEIVKTLENLPGAEEIEEILGLVDQVVAKLEAL